MAETGDRFGYLVVVADEGKRTAAQKRILRCRCDCGTEKEVIAASLISGRTKSCGCRSRDASTASRKTAVGHTYGRWTVTAKSDRKNAQGSTPYWFCKCACGTEKEVSGGGLRSGASTSCGCYTLERTKEALTKHGLCCKPEYGIWQRMIDRCYNPKASGYKYYGGKGVKVCTSWLASVETFMADMGPRPGPDYSIDREDSSKDYEPGNCRWLTKAENTRRAHLKNKGG